MSINTHRSFSDKNGWLLEIVTDNDTRRSKGIVYGETDDPIATIDRNHPQFPFSFVEDHPSGDDFLICGENYQGQTVINLSTGERKDFLPDATAQGHGFCWAGHEFDAESSLLLVEGCNWACPYEYRLYDFSDPIGKGWPQIPSEEYISAYDGHSPTLSTVDGITTVTSPHCRYIEIEEIDDMTYENEEGEEDYDEYIIVGTMTLQLKEGSLVLIANEYTPEETLRREEKALAYEKERQKWEAYCSTDAVFLSTKEAVLMLLPSGEGQVTMGYYPGTSSDTDREHRLIRYLYASPTWFRPRTTIEMHWGEHTSPIVLEISHDFNKITREYERTPEGSVLAIEEAVNLLAAYGIDPNG